MNKIMPAIVVVGYQRAKSLNRILQSISNAVFEDMNIPLIISIDYSDCNDDVIAIANSFDWKYGQKTVRTFDINQGLRNHIIQCGDISILYGGVIILEDDLFVSPYFYKYAIEAMNYYKNDERIAGIALYSYQVNNFAQREFIPLKSGYDIFFSKMAVTWGQCWTKTQWINFKEWYFCNQELPITKLLPKQVYKWPTKSSWGKYFTCYTAVNNKYYVMPYNSLSTNFTEIGQHNTRLDSSFQVPLLGFDCKWNFCDFSKSYHYDTFFEIEDNVFGYGSDLFDDLTVDLYGLKESMDTRYCLSIKKMKSKILEKYALQMRPHEENIKNRIEGIQAKFFLYDLTIPANNEFIDSNEDLAIYELRSVKLDLIRKYLKMNVNNLNILKYKKILGKIGFKK